MLFANNLQMMKTPNYWQRIANELETDYGQGHPSQWRQETIEVFLSEMEEDVLSKIRRDVEKARLCGVPFIKGRYAVEQWKSVNPVTFRRIFQYNNSSGNKSTKHQFAIFLGYKSFEDYVAKNKAILQVKGGPAYTNPNNANAIITANASDPFIIGDSFDRNDYIRALVVGGGLAGVVTATITLILKDEIGLRYVHLPHILESAVPLIYLSQLSSGVLGGWLSGKAIMRLAAEPDQKKRLKWLVIYFCIGLVLFAVIRQMATTSSFYRDGGGLLGKPDLETLATSLSCAGGVILIAKFLSSSPWPDLSLRIRFSIFSSAIFGVLFFAGTYWMYLVLKGFGVIPVNECNCLINTGWFNFQFPRPHRILFVIPFGFIHLMLVTSAVGFYRKFKSA